MGKNKYAFVIVILMFGFSAQSQCDYSLNNYKHVDCWGDNTGVIDITINPNLSYWWTGPAGFNSTSPSLNNLSAGDYVLHIMQNLLPGDTSSSIICYVVDTLTIEQTLRITATFNLSAMCSEYDSTNVTTEIWGGTPPYTTQWSTGEMTPNVDNLAPSSLPYTLLIIDTNNCARNQFLTINTVQEINPFMSSVGVVCKDDNSGSARVFVTEGTPPFQFQWSTDSSIVIEHDSFSLIDNLIPGEYHVKITDDMGCISRDTIEVKSNPDICITVYKVFSPNDDNIHEFWEIENIHLYPDALVEVYDRTGRQVYRRRNYINAEEHAFGGKDQQARTLPSGTYYYIIDLANEDAVFKGTLTIVR